MFQLLQVLGYQDKNVDDYTKLLSGLLFVTKFKCCSVQKYLYNFSCTKFTLYRVWQKYLPPNGKTLDEDLILINVVGFSVATRMTVVGIENCYQISTFKRLAFR